MSDEPLEITEKGRALIESGLSTRHLHEIETGCSSESLCTRCRCDLGDRSALIAEARRLSGLPMPEVVDSDVRWAGVLLTRLAAELQAAQRPASWYATAEFPGVGLPPNIEDTHPTREGAEREAQEMRDAASFSHDYRVYEVREVQP